MSVLQNALQQVGYKPTKTRRKDLATILDEVIAPITKHPKTHVTKAGGFYRVRFEGRATSCFGSTIVEAKKRLRILDQMIVSTKRVLARESASSNRSSCRREEAGRMYRPDCMTTHHTVVLHQ